MREGSIAGILRDAAARLVDFPLRNRIEVVEVLKILSERGQHLLRDPPPFQVIEPLRFETEFHSSFVPEPGRYLGLVGRGASVRQGTGRGTRSCTRPDPVDDMGAEPYVL